MAMSEPPEQYLPSSYWLGGQDTAATVVPNPRTEPGSGHRHRRPTQKLLPPVTMAYTQKLAATTTTPRMSQKTTRRITR
jgi:hypothetical protein